MPLCRKNQCLIWCAFTVYLIRTILDCETLDSQTFKSCGIDPVYPLEVVEIDSYLFQSDLCESKRKRLDSNLNSADQFYSPLLVTIMPYTDWLMILRQTWNKFPNEDNGTQSEKKRIFFKQTSLNIMACHLSKRFMANV